MKLKKRNRFIAMIMAMLMLAGTIPMGLMTTTAKAEVSGTQTFILDSAGLTPGTSISVDTTIGTENFFKLYGAGPKILVKDISGAPLSYGGVTYKQVLQLGGGLKSNGQAGIGITLTAKARVTIYAAAKSTSASTMEYCASGSSTFTTTNAGDLSDKAINKYVFDVPAAGNYIFGATGGANIFNMTVEYNPVIETVTPWADVATPVVDKVAVNSEGNFVVDFTSVIDANKGAEALNITMLENGHEVSTQTFKAQTSQAVFTPLWSGNYTFVATAQRTGAADKASTAVKYDNYILSVPKPVISMAQNKGNGSLYIDWINVKDANSYKVEYKTAGAADSAYVVAADNLTAADYTFSGLTAGTTYTIKVTALRQSDNYTSFYTKDVAVTSAADQNWYVATVGSAQATAATITDASGVPTSYSLGSTSPKDLSAVASIANTTGKIALGAQSSGKISDDEEGFSYYFTNIDPDKENFSLSATFKITDVTQIPDNQSGFGLIATDMLGINFYGDADIYHKYFNSVANLLYSSTGKFLGLRTVTGYSGVNTSLTDGGERLVTGTRFTQTTGNFAAGTTYTLTLEKTNDAFVAKCNGEVISSGDTSILSVQEDGSICVGIMVSRKIGVEVSGVSFSTSASTGITGGSKGDAKVTPNATIYSTNTCGAATYEYIYQPNVAGILRVTAPSGEVIYNKVVAASAVVKINVPVSVGQNTITAAFKPDTSATITSADEFTRTTVVERKMYGTEGQTIVVSATGSASGDGSEANPLDIYTAVKYAQPGQTILLKNGTYSGSFVTIARSVSGTADKNITMTAETAGGVVFDKIGLIVVGSYWRIYGLSVVKSSGVGIQVSGNHNIIEMCTIDGSANSGLQISRNGSAENAAGINDLLWPSYNLIKNCESFNNCDSGRNDADGFAAKLTCGEGNVFYGCISHNNIDDGWDLYAKTVSGEIGAVTIENCVAYSNGWLSTDDVTAAGYVYGEGNGFKLGGSYMKGGHILKNSIAFNNGAKGITSNSCPDCQIINCTAFNNSVKSTADYSLGLNTKDMNVKEWVVKGLISISNKTLTNLADLIPFSLHSADNYLYNGNASYNNQGVEAVSTWFESTDVKALPARSTNGTIDMHGLLTLKASAPVNTGARLDLTSAAAISEKPVITAFVGSTPVVPPVDPPVVEAAADYSAVTAAVASASALTASDYVDFSAVTTALNAVQTGLKISEQSKVDAMAKAINDAVAALVKKTPTVPEVPTAPVEVIAKENEKITSTQILDAAKTLTENAELLVNVSKGSVGEISNDVFKAAAEKKATVKIITDRYTWEFANIPSATTAALTSPIISIDTNVAELAAKLASTPAVDAAKVVQISFAHDGVLPASAKVSMSVNGKYAAGTLLHFYYFNPSTGLFESVQTCTVNNDGFVTVTLAHCSDYVLSADELPQTLITAAASTDGSGTVTVADSTSNTSGSVIVSTGDKAPILVFVIALIISAMATAAAVIFKKSKKEN